MPTTSVREIALILPGSFGKETLSNDGMQNLALGISGAAIIALAGTDVTLSEGTTGQAQHFVQILTGTLSANVAIMVPAESRVYVADNRTTGAFTVTFRTASGSGVAVEQGARTLIYCDGSDVYPVASGTGGGGGSGAPPDASYLVSASHTLLSGERVVTDTATVTWDLATTGQARAQIPDGAVTYAKLQDVTPARLLGRFTAGAGDAQEITPGTGLTLDASGVLSVVAGGGAQPLDATLTALAAVSTGANTLPYFTGVDAAAGTPLTPFARTLLDDADQGAMQTTLGVVPGTTVQPLDATLTALAGVTTGADRLAFFTDVDTATTTVLTPLARTLLDDTTQAAMQATIGVTPGGGATPGGSPGQVQYHNAGAFGGSSALTLDATTLLTLAPLTTKGDLLVQGGSAPARLAVGTNGQVLTADSAEGTGVKWGTPAAPLTTEEVQDVVGAMATDSATIDYTYDDTTGTFTSIVKDASLTEAKLSLSDVTTQNATASAHGLLPKLSGVATEYINGVGGWSTPAGGGTSGWTRVAGVAGSTASSGLLAFWRLEEASGNRLDSVANQVLVPTGAPGSAAGKTGQAVSFDTGSGKYLAIADSATLSVGVHQDFTVACWVRFNATPSGARGLVGKGNASVSYNNCEYLLNTSGTALYWYIGNGSSSINVNAGVTLAGGTWYLVIAWYDAAADLQYVQVNNGTPVSIANANGSFDSTGPLEVGRQPLYTGTAAFDGLIDNVMFWKRVLTATERSDLWNGGAGRDYADLVPTPSFLHPATSTDAVLAGASTLTATEPLESAGGLKLGTSTGTVDGIVRWTGTDMEVRKGGVWVSMTGQGLGTLAQQDASAVAITGGAISLGGHAPTGVLDVQGSVVASDVANAYMGVRVWPVAPGGAQYSQALRVEAVTGAGLATTQAVGLAILAQPGSLLGAVGLQVDISGGTNRYNIYAGGTAQNYFAGNVGIANAAPSYPLDVTGNVRVTGSLALGTTPDNKIQVLYVRPSGGMAIRPDTDSGGGAHAFFLNAAAAVVGSITCTGSATAFNTSSDVRLKHAVQALSNALSAIQALRPVRFRWNSTDEADEGFLAHELQQVIPHAVTGEPDAVNEDGSVKPQQVDHSKLVVWLVGAVQELAARLDAAGV